jgi:prepilin-type N-terminal cleavage/methylation domain-containing protein
MTRESRKNVAGGFTLMEVMVVMLLSTVATLALVGFYLNAQAMWTDASTQALAQRDASAILELMRSKVHEADSAVVLPSSSDSLNHRVILYDPWNNRRESFYWSPADSTVHYADSLGVERGAVVSTVVERFHVTMDGVLPLLTVDLRMRSASGQKVEMSSTIGFYSAP